MWVSETLIKLYPSSEKPEYVPRPQLKDPWLVNGHAMAGAFVPSATALHSGNNHVPRGIWAGKCFCIECLFLSVVLLVCEAL